MDIKFYLKEYSWLVILVAIGLGLWLPNTGLVIKPYVSYLLMGLMFLSCVNIDFSRSWKHLKKVRKVFASLLVIHVLSALIVYLLKDFFTPEVFLGLILVSVMPVGISVIFLSKLYGGSTAKSLVISSLSNVISPMVVPLMVLWLARVTVNVDVWAMFWTIFKLVVIPIVLARLAERTFLKKIVEAEGTYISIIILFLLIWGVIAPVGKILIIDEIFYRVVLVVVLLVLLNLCIGLWLGSDWKAKKTYAISLAYKNFTLAMVLALTLFGPQVAVPAAIYTLINNLMLIPLQWMWGAEKK